MSVDDNETSDYASIARVLRGRRTVHDFTTTRPDDTIVEEAIELARWAPNHLRTEPWHFYLLDHAVGMRIAELNAEIVEQKKGEKIAAVKRKRWSAMPGWLIVTCKTSDETIQAREDYAACCCAVHNMVLYLWSRGIGTKWTTGAVTREPRLFDMLGIDRQAEEIVGLFWYGYPVSVPDQHRRSVEDISSRVRISDLN